MLRVAGSTGDVNAAIERELGLEAAALSKDWQASIAKTYAPILEAATPPHEAGRLVITGKDSGGELNVGPAISPDGRWIAFLSERSFFSIDLYVAETATGRIVHKLTSTATDPHYSSIQFIYSAGAWDSMGQRLAVATVTAGQPALAIFDAASGKKEREIPLSGVDEIRNPTWAPDGHAIAFTGMRQGLTDLFVYDLTAATLRPLTNDAYADLQPSWSPDGRRIAFATDRFSSDLGTLAVGACRLALIDPETGVITPVPAFPSGKPGPPPRGRGAVGWKHLDPQWSPDGQALYFVADRDGIANVYRIALANGELAQVTDVGTGVSGITNTSPALSVASPSGTLAFTVYDRGTYDIYALDAPVRGASGVVAYPFDRARRVEFQSGMSRISFDQIVNTTTYSLFTGAVYERTTRTTSFARPLTLGTSAAAYVFDTTSFGATSPVQGQRYRFELDPTYGTINFAGLLADYRRYVMPVSFYTVGVRVMHYGRYGSGGEDARLFPLYVGYPGLVRGCDVYSIDASECVSTAESVCPLIDRLLGSRMLIGNLELRFPLLRPFGLTSNMYGPVPVEVALFTDSGVAWTSGDTPSWLGGSRGGVSSAGVAFRVNLFGFAVGELDLVRPFQRPGRGWTFAFNVLQGW